MRLLLLLTLLAMTTDTIAQIVGLAPAKPALGEKVVITFYADQGDKGLQGYDGDVYLHTGLITNQSTNANDWKKVVSDWFFNDDKLKLDRAAPNVYTLTCTISDLYGVPATGGNVVGLAMVFRSADGSRTGKTVDGGDIIYYLSEPDFRGPAEILRVSQTPAPAWADSAVIYEVNVRQYTAAGTLAAFADHLPRLAEMGVDILWMMPVQPIGTINRKGVLGSYYSIADYTAIHPDMGTEADFKAVVQQAHDLGMKVVLDWVANHTAFDHHWAEEHPSWYTRDADGKQVAPYDWSDVADLNHNSAEMRQEMIKEMLWWIVKMDIDGFRCDVAGEVDTDFWEMARRALEQLKPIWMLAENGDKMDLLNHAFNANYAWDLHHTLNSIAKGEKTVHDIYGFLTFVDRDFPNGTYPMHFVSNHDENSWKGTVYERYGGGHKAFAALTFTLPGMPLIYSGMEAGLDKRLAFFDKDEIDWSDLSLVPFYHSLTSLKHDHPALWNGRAGGAIIRLANTQEDRVITFARVLDDDTLVVVINLSPDHHQVNLELGDLAGQYIPYFGTKNADIGTVTTMDLAPWSYEVYTRR